MTKQTVYRTILGEKVDLDFLVFFNFELFIKP